MRMEPRAAEESTNILQVRRNAIANMTIDDDATPSEAIESGKAEMALSTSPQNYTPVGGLAVNGEFTVWHFLDTPMLPAGLYTAEANHEIVTSQFV